MVVKEGIEGFEQDIGVFGGKRSSEELGVMSGCVPDTWLVGLVG
jgi:hypothetical protein